MPLSSGARVGVFEIVTKLGEGGMGEVYRARDTKLGREVALKVLPELFTSDPDRLARFEREAKVLASLNHPNIAQVYGFEGNAIAMELVEGETLDEVLRSWAGGLPLDRALSIMRQVATALEAAHDQGIVHRDLKPANIKLREDGTVKVLDFGLAKAFATEAESSMPGVANSPTLTARATQLGMIIGTAAYMAPEQAKGRAVDRRADVWAFGAVFFELLTGHRAFEGEDVSEVLASVLKSDPSWNLLPADLPQPVRRLLRRCLEKDPKKRLRDVGEGMLQLDEGLANAADAAEVGSPKSEVLSSAQPRWRRALPVGAAILVTAAAAYGVYRATLPGPVIQAPVRFSVDTTPHSLNVTNNRRDLAISPDGRAIVYTSIAASAPLLVIRRFDHPEPVPLRGGESAVHPFFSPDGQWVGFLSSDDGSTIKKVTATGGPPITLCRLPHTLAGAAWMSDGTIVMGGPLGPLLRVSEAGGIPEPITELDKSAQESDHLWPSAIQGTSLILFATSGGAASPIAGAKLAVMDLSSKRVVRLGIPGSHPVYVPTGHIIYASIDGTLRAVRFDVRALSVSGTPVPVVEAVSVKGSGAANFDVSEDGRLIYVSSSGQFGLAASRTIAWVDRSGKETPIGAPTRNYYYARISPDQKQLSLDVRDQEEDIWIWDLGRETISRLTDKPGADQYGLWLPDGRLVFTTSMFKRLELAVHRSDGVGEPQQLTDTAADKLIPFPNAISPGGKQVIFRSAVGNKNDLFIVDVGDKKFRKLLGTTHDEKNAALSPDGRFMAFESDLSGQFEIYVRTFPDVDTRQWQVSTAGGIKALWSPTGAEIFYLTLDGKMMAVPVKVSPEFSMLKPVELFKVDRYFVGAQGRNYDVTRDGKRFVMVKNQTAGAGGVPNPVHVVLNWVDELKSRLK